MRGRERGRERERVREKERASERGGEGELPRAERGRMSRAVHSSTLATSAAAFRAPLYCCHCFRSTFRPVHLAKDVALCWPVHLSQYIDLCCSNVIPRRARPDLAGLRPHNIKAVHVPQRSSGFSKFPFWKGALRLSCLHTIHTTGLPRSLKKTPTPLGAL